MLSKIYFFFFVIGFIGSVLSIVRSLSKEGKVEMDWLDYLSPFLFFTSFFGITFVQFKAFSNSINVPVSIFVGFFFTYYSQVLFKADQKGPVL